MKLQILKWCSLISIKKCDMFIKLVKYNYKIMINNTNFLIIKLQLFTSSL